MTSADFIRQQGQKPAKEIQALAKAKLGRPISPEYVYLVRWADKKRAHKPPQKRATSTARMGVKTQAEATFMKLQLELGITRRNQLVSLFDETVAQLCR